MDPLICPMCQGAIPGREIQGATLCPECGADISLLVKERVAPVTAVTPAPRPANPFLEQADLFSLLAPCFSVGVTILGRQAVRENDMGMLVLGSVCSLFVVAGLIFGIVAFFNAGKGETRGKAIAGICINGLILAFAVFNILSYQKIAARENSIPDQPPRGWSYMSGK